MSAVFAVIVVAGTIAMYAFAFWLDMRQRREAKRLGEALNTHGLAPPDPRLMGTETLGYDTDAYYRSEQDHNE